MKHPGREIVPFGIEVTMMSNAVIKVGEQCGGMSVMNTALPPYDAVGARGEELLNYVVGVGDEASANALADALIDAIERFRAANPAAVVTIHDPSEWCCDDEESHCEPKAGERSSRPTLFETENETNVE